MDNLAISLFSFIGMVLSVMVSTVLIYFPLSRREYGSPNTMLGIAYFLMAYILFTSLLLYSGFILYTPHLYQTRIIALYLYLPTPMLYLRNMIKRQAFNKKDLLHFLPAVIAFLDLLPFFLNSHEKKQAYIIDELSDLDNAIMANVGFILPNALHFLAISILFTFYLIAQIRMIWGLYMIKEDDFWEDNGPWVRWLSVYIISQLMMVLPLVAFFWMFSPVYWVTWATVMFGVTASLTASYLMTHPGILYGIKGILIKEDLAGQSINEDPSVPEPKSEYLSEEQIQNIKNKLEPFMQDNKPYLQKGYSLKDLSLDIGLHHRLLSAYMNHYLGMNFYDYINRYRVDYLSTGMKREELNNLTLEALAEKAGFNNRTSFVQAVKKFTGMTPSEYVNKIRQSVEQ